MKTFCCCAAVLFTSLLLERAHGFTTLVQHQTSLFRAHAGPCAFGGAAVCSLSARPSDATPGSVLGMAMQERRGGRGGAGEGEHLFGVRAAGGAAALPRVAVEDRRGARKRSLGKAAHVQILHACARTVTARRYA